MSSLPSGDCYQYRAIGSCRFGASCKFVHQSGRFGSEFLNKPQPTDTPIPSLPNNRRGGGGEDDGRCYEFSETGSCRYGSSCKFNHDQMNPSRTQPTRLSYRDERRYDHYERTNDREYDSRRDRDRYDERLERDRFGMSSSSPSLSDMIGGGPGPCYQWKDTRSCRFGETCKFAHDNGPTPHEQDRYGSSASGYIPSSVVHGVGSSARGPCYQYSRSGICRFGSTCLFSHDRMSDRTPSDRSDDHYSNHRHISSSYRPSSPQSRSFERHSGPSRGPCYQFIERGTCQWGAQCRFDHPTGSTLPSSSSSSHPHSMSCYDWLNLGSCRFGDGCKFSHDVRLKGVRSNSSGTSEFKRGETIQSTFDGQPRRPTTEEEEETRRAE